MGGGLFLNAKLLSAETHTFVPLMCVDARVCRCVGIHNNTHAHQVLFVYMYVEEVMFP